jgi:hypothetical protein
MAKTGDRAASGPKPDRQPPAQSDFWRRKTIEQLAAEQGVSIPQNIDHLLGAGADLWADDAEFDAFLDSLRESRRTAR